MLALLMANKILKILSTFIVVSLLLSACSGEPDRKILIETYEPNNFTVECVDLSLQSPDSIKVNEGFTVEVKVTNTCEIPITVEYGAGSDLLITNTSGETIWQRYQGGPIITILYTKLLVAGESFEGAVFTWDGKDSKNEVLSEGNYQAVVLFNILDRDTPTSNLEIVKSFQITN